ncbi:MAG: pilin [Candidatus Roizmanbacteria bacterium]
MRSRLLLFFLTIIFLFCSSIAHAEDVYRDSISTIYATCDQCGFCVPSGQDPTSDAWKNARVPGDWPACAKCLYTSIVGADPQSSDAYKGDTLKIVDSVSYLPPSTDKGKHYTGLGCFGTDVAGGFTSQGAAGSVVQTLFNFLFGITGSLSFLYLMYGGFIYMTSQANPERLAFGKRIVSNAIIAVIFTASALTLINIIASGFLKIPGFG